MVRDAPLRGAPHHEGKRASPKHPVHEPGRRGDGALRHVGARHVAIKPGAEQPEAVAAFVLDAEIIAGAVAGGRDVLARFLMPPHAFDALGAVGGGDVVQRAPPLETQRRAVRHFGDDLDRLGLR